MFSELQQKLNWLHFQTIINPKIHILALSKNNKMKHRQIIIDESDRVISHQSRKPTQLQKEEREKEKESECGFNAVQIDQIWDPQNQTLQIQAVEFNAFCHWYNIEIVKKLELFICSKYPVTLVQIQTQNHRFFLVWVISHFF